MIGHSHTDNDETASHSDEEKQLLINPDTKEPNNVDDSGSSNNNDVEAGAEPVRARTKLTMYSVGISCIAAVGGLLFGYDTGVVSGALPLLEDEFSLSAVEEEAFVSAAVAACVVGALVGGPMSDRIGRRPTIIFAAVLFAIGAAVLTISTKYWMLLVGRIILGFGVGKASMISPVYIAEASPQQFRGALVTLNNFAITGGQFVAYVVAALFSKVNDGWRYSLGLSGVPAVILFVGMLAAPESPRWLVGHGRADEARRTLLRVYGGNAAEVEREVEDINDALSKHVEVHLREVFTRRMRRPLAIGILIQAFQQFCGINTAMYYSATIIKMAGFDDNSTAIWFSTLVALGNAFSTVICLFLIDRVGRRKLLCVSLSGITLGLTVLGLAFYLNDHGEMSDKASGFTAVGALVFYTLFFALGMGPVPWALTSEIFPLKLRGVATGITTTANWLSNLIVSMSFLSLMSLITKAGVYWLYGGVCIVCLIFVLIL